jgi:hypothetical protein
MKHTHFPLVKSRWIAVAILIFLFMALLVGPTFAITHGEPDGNDHPFVGSMVLSIPGVGMFQWCSGTLIAPTVFLTAAHCTAPVAPTLAQFPGAEMLITFDPSISDAGEFYSGTIHAHPKFTNFRGAGGRSDPYDIAVIILDEDPGIAPAQLPTTGLLDDLKAARVLKNTRFTAVGYGTVRETNTTGWQGILSNVNRNRAEQGFFSLTKAWLNLPMMPNLDSGGTCYGDSGGPHFIHLDGEETTIVASITVTGDYQCKATDVTYRTDTESARIFLGEFVTLP